MKSLDSIVKEEVALVVDRIVRASRAAALAAFDQHFDQLGREPQHQQVVSPGLATPARRTKNRSRTQRSTKELAALEARLLSAVRSNPGQPIATLAPQVGVKAEELRVPIVRLKAKKQIKLVGQRQFTCYFPVDEDVAA